MKLSCSSSSHTKRSFFFETVQWDETQSLSIQMQATEQYFPMVLFFMLFEVIPIFDFVDEIPKCVRSDSKEGY